MRIVSLSEFLTLPWGTLFHKFEPTTFGDLQTYEGTAANLPGDFFSEPLSEPMPEGAESSEDYYRSFDTAQTRGESVPLVYGQNMSRDALYQKDQLFAVYEKQDVERLIAYLQQQLVRAY